jgi:hypothetical protein
VASPKSILFIPCASEYRCFKESDTQDEAKCKEQLIIELNEFGERLAELEQYKAGHNLAEKAVMQERGFAEAAVDSRLPGVFYFLDEQGQF